jgi:hypothetical protein
MLAPPRKTRQQLIFRSCFLMLPNDVPALPSASQWVIGVWMVREKGVVGSQREKRKS